jgi:hypothetical protein
MVYTWWRFNPNTYLLYALKVEFRKISADRLVIWLDVCSYWSVKPYDITYTKGVVLNISGPVGSLAECLHFHVGLRKPTIANEILAYKQVLDMAASGIVDGRVRLGISGDAHRCHVLVKALLTRMLFGGHAVVTIWRTTIVLGRMYWILASGLGLLLLETGVCVIRRRGQEWKW